MLLSTVCPIETRHYSYIVNLPSYDIWHGPETFLALRTGPWLVLNTSPCPSHCFHNIWIRSTSTQIPRQILAGLIFARIWIFIQQRRSCQDKPRRTICTLECLFVDEGLLNRMKLAVRFKTFNSHYLFSSNLLCQCQTSTDWFAIYQHGTSSTHADATSLFRAD